MRYSRKGLGRYPHFDGRNVDYLIQEKAGATAATFNNVLTSKALGVLASRGDASTIVPTQLVRDRASTYEYHWRFPWDADQGQSPMCTGFGGMKLWLNGPVTHPDIKMTPEQAQSAAADLYRDATAVDRAEGRVYSDGATMLALAKAMRARQMITRYWWGYSLTDLITALRTGPVLLGIWWREGMDSPDRKAGIIRYLGKYRGGHCISATGVDLEHGLLRLDQTWGREWGLNGQCYMPLEDVERAIADDGEVLLVEETQTTSAHDPATLAANGGF